MRLYPGILSAAIAAMMIAGPAYAEHQSDADTSTKNIVDDDFAEADEKSYSDDDPVPLEASAEDDESDGFRFYLEDGDHKEARSGDLHGFARRVSITGYSGTNFTGFGDFVEGQRLTGVGGGGTLVIPERDFGDVYNRPITFGFDINHGLHRLGEIFASFHYTYADSQRFNFMTISPAAGGVTALSGEFSDYHEFGVDFGYRHYFREPGGFTPYIGGRVGFKLVSDIDLDLSPAGIGLLPASAFSDIDFFDTTITYNIGFDVGVQYWVRPNITLGVETGIHYSGDLDSDEGLAGFDSTIGSITGAGGSLAGANDDGSRLMIPLTVKVRIDL